MEGLYKLRETLCTELEKLGDTKLTAESLKLIDTLAHATKNLDKIIDVCEAEEGKSYGEHEPGRGMDTYAVRSFARGRRNAPRDAMGRYSRHSGHEAAEEIRGLMHAAPDEETRREMERLVEMLERS